MKANFFPRFALTDRSYASLCATFGMAVRNWNWTALFKILDPPLGIIEWRSDQGWLLSYWGQLWQ